MIVACDHVVAKGAHNISKSDNLVVPAPRVQLVFAEVHIEPRGGNGDGIWDGGTAWNAIGRGVGGGVGKINGIGLACRTNNRFNATNDIVSLGLGDRV